MLHTKVRLDDSKPSAETLDLGIAPPRRELVLVGKKPKRSGKVIVVAAACAAMVFGGYKAGQSSLEPQIAIALASGRQIGSSEATQALTASFNAQKVALETAQQSAVESGYKQGILDGIKQEQGRTQAIAAVEASRPKTCRPMKRTVKGLWGLVENEQIYAWNCG